jgi:Ice-binding-like/Stigma-specific protein, Stig1
MLRASTLRLLVVPFALSLACSSPRTSSVASAATAPTLGMAQSFAVLAGSMVTNTGNTVVSGDLGVSPGSAVTGFPPGLVNNGTIHAADAVALQAQSDDTAVYNTLAGQKCNFDLTGKDLVGLTLVAGVYCFSSSAQLSGALTLDAEGDPSAVFIFQIGSTLTTASNASVQVINGGQGCNVFWQVGSSATIGTGTSFVGNIFALTSVALTTGASVSGRALAQTGAVTMDTNNVSFASCATGSPADGGVGGAADGGVGGAPGADAGTGPTTCCRGTACDTSCFDLMTDSSHCGSCDHACASDENCQLGACTTCAMNVCGTACVDLVSDNDNCGNCGNVCAPTAPCVGGFCGACPGTICGRWCVDLQSDRQDCGACGNVCQTEESCIRGSCTLVCLEQGDE